MRMRTIRYGFFGEDDAQRLFLHHYLTALATGADWQFEADTAFPLRGGNKRLVLAQFDEACAVGLLAHRHECFFVGLDVDSHDTAVFAQMQREMQEKLTARQLTAVLMLPVQCIEHWLRYLHWRTQNPGSTKNMTFETEERKAAKTALYGSPKTSTRHSNPIVESIAQTLDIAWLESRSRSFLTFHNQVKTYLQSQGLGLNRG